MKFTKKSFAVLRSLDKKSNFARHGLKKTTERVREYDRRPKPTNAERAKKCWNECYENCSPFRTGKVIDPLCNFCPGIRKIRRGKTDPYGYRLDD